MWSNISQGWKNECNKTSKLEKQNYTPRKHHQHHHHHQKQQEQQQEQHQQQQQQQLPPLIPANGLHSSSQNEGLTIDLKNFRRETFTQCSHLFVGNLPPDITEEEMRKLFEKYGKAGDVFTHEEKGFYFLLLESGTLMEIAKVDLDNMLLCAKQLQVLFTCHSTILTVHNLPQYVSSELLEEAFSVFGQVDRAAVIVNDLRRS